MWYWRWLGFSKKCQEVLQESSPIKTARLYKPSCHPLQFVICTVSVKLLMISTCSACHPPQFGVLRFLVFLVYFVNSAITESGSSFMVERSAKENFSQFATSLVFWNPVVMYSDVALSRECKHIGMSCSNKWMGPDVSTFLNYFSLISIVDKVRHLNLFFKLLTNFLYFWTGAFSAKVSFTKNIKS